MPIENYGVLKARPIDRRVAVSQNPHYQVRVVDDERDYRLAINVLSKLSPSEVLYLIDENFTHPVLARLESLADGFHPLESRPASGPGGLALDFIRGNLFNPAAMKPLPFNVPGLDNDLNEKLDRIILQALADEEAMVYAFGQKWPLENKPDKIWGFRPNTGVHDIHMNQGNKAQFVKDDGVWQDGALLVHFPTRRQWAGVFIAFQSQAWHTDDKTGHAIEGVTSDGIVRIIAALVNPAGDDPGRETVTLLNTANSAIDLTGWSLADRLKNKQRLSGTIAAGAALNVRLTRDVQLGNQGGIITLLNAQGLKIDGVSYTQAQASREGWTIVF